MICEKCGALITTLEVNMFDCFGGDYWTGVCIEEVPENAVYFDVPTNWTGDELDEEEQIDCVRCPMCHEWPFKKKEVQTYTSVRVVMFKDGDDSHERDN